MALLVQVDKMSTLARRSIHIRLQILPNTIVPVPTAKSKITRRLQRVSTAGIDRTKESVKVSMDEVDDALVGYIDKSFFLRECRLKWEKGSWRA